jgi:signal transduction histidine kinase
VNRLRLSLRSRIALVSMAAFVVGYFLVRVAVDVGRNVARSFGGDRGSCRSPSGLVHPCAVPYGPGPRDVYLVLLVLGAIAVVLALWLAAHWLVQPLSRMAETVGELGPQNLSQRIRWSGPSDALKELANAVDTAMDRVAAGYEGQRRFAANASHELRTPLAVQRTLVEVALDDAGANGDVQRLARQLLLTNERNEALIEGLLTLAESDRGLTGPVPVSLDELVASVLDAYAPLAERSGLAVERELVKRSVAGDPVLLERLVTNLVQNAVNYNCPGGNVSVHVGGEPALSVHNSGPEVAAELVPGLFEPFRRLASDRTSQGGGAGLGLSIVRSIATAHGGTVRACPGESGGLLVEVFLPHAT